MPQIKLSSALNSLCIAVPELKEKIFQDENFFQFKKVTCIIFIFKIIKNDIYCLTRAL